jgi:dihydrodipicolinate synthase/N-acetylneuraminate lyase
MAKAIAAGDEGRATAFHEKLTEFNSWITRFPAPIGVKRAMELRGQKSGSPAIPLGPGKQKLLDEFAAWFSGWIREAISNRT